MTATSLVTPTTSSVHLTLSRRRLPTWSFPVLGVGVVLLTLALFAVTPLQGRADFLVVVVPTYAVVQTAVSRAVEGRRAARDRLATIVVGSCFLVALIPLGGVLGYTVVKGLKRLDYTFLTHSMRNVAEQDAGGGAYHAIVGTVEQVGLAAAIAVPFGLLTAIYLTEYSHGRFGKLVSFFVDVMTGLPSIVAGLFIYALWVLALGQGYSGFAGSLALLLLMIPTVVRSAEEMLKLVPTSLREAAYALGLPQWKTVLRVVLPTALPGIITGVMLAVARVIGETAPLLLTVAFTASINNNPFHGAQAGLPLFIFSEAMLPNDTAIDRAWAGALTLIIIIMVLNLGARLVARLATVRR